MKPYILILLFLSSCGYYKESEVRQNTATGEAEYVVWVMHDCDVVKSFRAPITGITCEKIIKLNESADSLLAAIKLKRHK